MPVRTDPTAGRERATRVINASGRQALKNGAALKTSSGSLESARPIRAVHRILCYKKDSASPNRT